MEGWLKKKSHHIGVWKHRFFRFDGRVLRYWKRQPPSDSEPEPRGEFALTGCQAVALHDELRLVLRLPRRDFDEELLASSSQERDAWVRLLNSSVSQQHRISVASCQVSTERFLRVKGLWEVLEGTFGLAAAAGGSGGSLEQHACFGAALLQLSEKLSGPRQGRFVSAGRRALQNLRRQKGDSESLVEPGRSESWLLLLTVRSLVRSVPLRKTRDPYERAEQMEGQQLLEALHAYAEPLDASQPFASLPLAHCFVSPEEECPDGSGWAVSVENRDPDTEAPLWTLILGSREECARWRYAIDVAIWAARAREEGRLRVAEEALVLFDTDAASWRATLAQHLVDAAPPARRSCAQPEEAAALGCILAHALAACEDVCADATDMLDAALAAQRKDVCEAALEAGIEPSAACAGRCWLHYNAGLSQGDGRALLRWLDAQHRELQRLGVAHAPLDSAVACLAAELSLRGGVHLRRTALNLLVQELLVGMRERTKAGSVAALQRSTLPVDLFTMVFSCLPFDREQDVLALRLSAQRVAKFVVYELQQALLAWLLATQPEAHRDLRPRLAERMLPAKVQQWLACLCALANSAPSFASQCAELDAVPLHLTPCCQATTFVAPDTSELGPATLPIEWSLSAESQRFGALAGAMLWAVCDVVSLSWRCVALGGPIEAASEGLSSLLRVHLDAPLQMLRRWLEPAAFARLLRRVFDVCLEGCVARTARGLWFQPPPPGEATEMAVFRLSEDAQQLCNFFRGLCDDEPAPWDPGKVLTRLHEARGTRGRRPSVAPLLSDGPLPLLKLSQLPAEQPFEELPPQVPGSVEAPGAGTRASPPVPVHRGSQPTLGRSPSMEGTSRKPPRRMMSMPSLSLFGSAPELPTESAPAEPGPNLSYDVCELPVHDMGTFGTFCCVLLCKLAEGSFQSEPRTTTPTLWRRRWVQLRRGSAGQPRFEILASRAAAVTLVSAKPAEARVVGTTKLELRLEGGLQVVLTLDCPSQLLRWARVLEAWSVVRLEGGLPSVMTRTGRTLPGWEDLPRELSRKTLEQRLGGLWLDVRMKLHPGAHPGA